MNNKEYVENALRTLSSQKTTINGDLLHAALGLVTESAEIADHVKRHIFYGTEIDYVNLKEELGDIFWYAAVLSQHLGVSFEDVMKANIAKLQSRYPNKFEMSAAINRDLQAERKALT